MWFQESPYLYSPTRGERDALKPRQRRIWLRVLLWLFACTALVFGFPFALQHLYVSGTNFDPAYRANAIHMIEDEIARLAPTYDDSISLGMDESNAPGRPVDVIAFYSLASGECPNVQTYYATRAPQVGWSIEQPIMSHRNEYTGVVTSFSKYRETVQGLNLELDVDCDDSASSGYTLGVFLA